MFLVQRELLFRLAFLVVLVFFLKLLEQRLELLHLLSGKRLFAPDREHESANENRQEDDRDPVISRFMPEQSRDPRGYLVGKTQCGSDHNPRDVGREWDPEPLVFVVVGKPLGLVIGEYFFR